MQLGGLVLAPGDLSHVVQVDDHRAVHLSETLRIELVAGDGKTTVLKKKLDLLEGEVIDATVMNVRALRKFFEEQIEDAKKSGVLLSLHLKATMMKISDPIMFGHCVSVYYKDALEKHAAVLKELGVNVNNGLGDVYEKIKKLPEAKKAEIEADIEKLSIEKDEAVKNADYERAAQIRDKLDSIKLKKKSLHREWRDHSKEIDGVVDEEVVAEVVLATPDELHRGTGHRLGDRHGLRDERNRHRGLELADSFHA